jgi:hypothetical protein
MNKIVPSMIKNTPFWKQGGVFFYMWNSLWRGKYLRGNVSCAMSMTNS